MTQRTRVSMLCGALCAAVVAGCASSPKPADTPAALAPGSRSKEEKAVFANQLADGESRTPASAPRTSGPAARLRIVQLEVYQLIIPLGAVSRSEEFWKHVDEQLVDVGTYDLLRKNGWRLGIAPNNEWGYFKDIIDSYPASAKPNIISTGPVGANGLLELTMKQNVAYQNIFYFNDQNRLFGRTFERSDNLLNIAVQQAPRKMGEARVTVCPTVRSLRRRFEVSTKNDEKVIEYVYPEHLYDLNIQVDIPLNHFLVIAPSPEAKWPTSLGATFLVDSGAAERFEQVMLMVPRAAELEENRPAPTVPTAAR